MGVGGCVVLGYSWIQWFNLYVKLNDDKERLTMDKERLTMDKERFAMDKERLPIDKERLPIEKEQSLMRINEAREMSEIRINEWTRIPH